MLVKAVLGVGLGLSLHAAPLLQWLGLPPWERLGAAIASWIPFNGGTGFYVSAEGHFIAPYHVLGDCPQPGVETPDELLLGRPVVSSRSLDIVVIRTDKTPLDHVRFPDFPQPAVLAPVAIARFRGCGGLPSWTVAAARATSMFGRARSGLALRARRPIEGGNSGSPVIDATGAVIGMLVARLQDRSDTGIAVDARTITRFLADSNVPFDTMPAVLDLEPETIAIAAARSTYPVLCLLPP